MSVDQDDQDPDAMHLDLRSLPVPTAKPPTLQFTMLPTLTGSPNLARARSQTIGTPQPDDVAGNHDDLDQRAKKRKLPPTKPQRPAHTVDDDDATAELQEELRQLRSQMECRDVEVRRLTMMVLDRDKQVTDQNVSHILCLRTYINLVFAGCD